MVSDTCTGINENGYPSDCQLTEALRKRAEGRKSIMVERSQAWQDALQYAQKIKILLLDVDGVLTDGGLIYGNDGEELKRFNSQDGLGLNLLRECGVDIGIITARKSAIVARRAEELKMKYVQQGARNKIVAFDEILRETGLRPLQIAYMGDDLLDLPLLNRVGFACAPQNGVAEVQQRVHYVTQKSGGCGAVREMCELIMDAQGHYPKVLGRFDQ